MTIFGDMLSSAMGGKMPEYNPSYVWEVQWLYDDEQCPPHKMLHERPRNALNHLMSLFDTNRNLVHVALTRQNA